MTYRPRRRRIVAVVLLALLVAAAVVVTLLAVGRDDASARPARVRPPVPRGYARNPKGRLDAQWITAVGFDPIDVVADRDGIVVQGLHEVTALNRDGRTVWRSTFAAAGSRTPALVGGAVVVGGAHEIVAFDRDEGRPRWRVAIPGGVREMNAVHLDRVPPTIVVAGQDGAVIALDAATGEFRWRVTLPAGALPTGASGRGDVLAVGWVATPAPGGVLSLDPATGATRWSAESLPYATVPAVVGERVVVAQCTDASAADGEVVGLDARTGARRWTAVTGGIFHPLTWIAVDGDEVYVPDLTGRVVALDAATGQRGWVSPRYVQSFRVTRPVIDRDVVMVPAGEGVLPVVALADGRLRARRLAYGDVIGVASAPGDRIVLAVRGPKPHVLAFDRRRFEALAAGRPR